MNGLGFQEPFGRCLNCGYRFPQSGHGTVLFETLEALGDEAAAVVPFFSDLYEDRADREWDGVAFLAISRSSTNEITSLIDILGISLSERASLLMSRSTIPASSTSFTVSVV